MIEYLKKLIKVLVLPILFGLGQIIIIFIFTLVFNNNVYNSMKNSELENTYELYYESPTYIEDLTQFINDNTIWIILISAMIFLPLFIYKYKKQEIKKNYKIDKNLIYVIINSISITIFLNLLIIIFNNCFEIKTNLTNYKYLFTLLLSTGIIGPILEELLFRGIVFNKLKKFNKENISILLTTLLFAFLHSSLTTMIYAFIIGYISIKIYQKTNNLLISIIYHVISNSLVVLLINSLVNLNLVFMILEIIISLLIFIFSYKMMNKKNLVA